MSVTLLNSLIPLPVFEPPESVEPVTTPQIESVPSTFGGGTRVEEQPVTTQTVSKTPVASPLPTSAILWGAASADAVGFFVAEAQRRKALHRARRDEEEECREREAAEAQQNALAQMFLNDKKPEPEPKTTPRKKKKPLTPQERLQAIWDRNGAMIYEINQAFKARFGREMDAAMEQQAIKDATVNGHFNAEAYADNLAKAATPPPPPPPPNPYAGAAARIRAGANEIDDEKKIGYQDIPPSQPASDLQAGLQALYEGRKTGEVQLDDIACTPENIQKTSSDSVAEAIQYGTDAYLSAKNASAAAAVAFKLTNSAKNVRVVVNPNSMGAKIYRSLGGSLDDIRPSLGLKTRGLVPTASVNGRLLGSLVKDVKGNFAVAGAVSLLANLWDYGVGEHKNEGIGSQGFWVSTGIDTGVSLGVGLVAGLATAGMVAVGTVIASAVVGTVVVAPAILTIGVAAVLGIGIAAALDYFDVVDGWKANVNNQLDTWQGE